MKCCVCGAKHPDHTLYAYAGRWYCGAACRSVHDPSTRGFVARSVEATTTAHGGTQ
ncbi:hypothetical protein ACTHQY_15055 [Rhodococcoides corynebacterioides]|uniref:hypothetical protein n=1 Tax=Rhodococcoides corynebacterioides TaxID=53972 RepID=UPI003F8159E3